MKKMLFVLTALALPLTAHAEEVQLAPKTMPEATIQAAIKEFADPWCKTGLQGLVENVQNCFKQTPESSPNIDKCVVGHYLLFRATKIEQKQSADNGFDDPTKNIRYIGPQVTHDRGVHYANLPRYKDSSSNYLIFAIRKARQPLDQNMSKCPSN